MSEDKNQRLTGYNKNKGLNYIIVHIKKYNLLMNSFISENLSILKKMFIIIDFVWCVLVYGAGINDYFQYNFYKRKAVDRKTFIVGRKWKKIIKACNGKINQPDFDDKSRFNNLFSKFLGRDWLDMDLCDEDEFIRFINKHTEAMYKIKNGSGGNGIGVIHLHDISNLHDKYNQLKNAHVLLEEVIQQNENIAEFNPSSVNTIRVVTVLCKDEVKIMSAVFRTGNGNGNTDNFHHYGLAALIDVETGVVITPAIDKKNQKYYFHPVSKKQIIGYHVPEWNMIKNKVIQAARVSPKVRYVGWDIAIKSDDTICIIEGNCAADPDIIQMPDQIGKWLQYKNVLDAMGG